MKKIYLVVAGIFSFTVVNAQVVKTNAGPVGKKNIAPLEKSTKRVIEANAKTEVLWSNNFSDATQWSFADNSGSGDEWVIGTGVPSGDFAIAGIMSTTADNGFALFDSDLMCSGNQNADVYTSNSIDLSTEDNVQIRFESFYRKFQGNVYVIASNDGVNWTQFEVHAGLAANGATANPAIVQVNLSSVIANQATAYVGFRYIGGCDYAWMVDDVSLETVEEYDLMYEGISWGSTGNWEERLNYPFLPLTQATGISFTGVVSNIGATDQNDAVFTASIPAASFTASSNPQFIAAGATDSLQINTSFTPSALALHIINAEVTSSQDDASPENNSEAGAAQFLVNEFIYGRDRGNLTGGYVNRDDLGNALPFEAGPVFDIYGTQNVYSADITINPNSTVGSTVYAILYDATDGNFNFVDESAQIELTAADLGETLNFPFALGPHTLNQGGTYMVVAATFGGPDGGFVVGASGTIPAQTAFYKDETNTWFFLGTAPMVRLNFEDVLSTSDAISAEFKLNAYPNPAQNVANVTFELANSSEVSLTLTDMSGKVVFTHTENANAGKNNIEMPTAGLSNGVYFYNFVANGSSTTRKLVVNK